MTGQDLPDRAPTRKRGQDLHSTIEDPLVSAAGGGTDACQRPTATRPPSSVLVCVVFCVSRFVVVRKHGVGQLVNSEEWVPLVVGGRLGWVEDCMCMWHAWREKCAAQQANNDMSSGSQARPNSDYPDCVATPALGRPVFRFFLSAHVVPTLLAPAVYLVRDWSRNKYCKRKLQARRHHRCRVTGRWASWAGRRPPTRHPSPPADMDCPSCPPSPARPSSPILSLFPAAIPPCAVRQITINTRRYRGPLDPPACYRYFADMGHDSFQRPSVPASR